MDGAAPALRRRAGLPSWLWSISRPWRTAIRRLGFANPAIYAIGKGTNYNSDFHDITSGNNNNGHGKSFNAVTGYDLVTGWGSPNGQNLINALAGSSSPSFTLSDSPGSLTITQGGAAGTSTITVTDIGGFSGSVSLAASGLPSGVTAGVQSESDNRNQHALADGQRHGHYRNRRR